MNKIVIPLDNGYKLIAEQNTGEFDKEFYIGIETESGVYIQDLVIVRPTYSFKDETVKFDSDKFELLVFEDNKTEDYTEKFVVPLVEDNDE